MTSACFSRGHTGFSRNATLVATVNPPALAGGVFNTISLDGRGMGEVTVLFRSLRTPSKTAGHPVAWLFLCSVKTVFFLAVVYRTHFIINGQFL